MGDSQTPAEDPDPFARARLRRLASRPPKATPDLVTPIWGAAEAIMPDGADANEATPPQSYPQPALSDWGDADTEVPAWPTSPPVEAPHWRPPPAVAVPPSHPSRNRAFLAGGIALLLVLAVAAVWTVTMFDSGVQSSKGSEPAAAPAPSASSVNAPPAPDPATPTETALTSSTVAIGPDVPGSATTDGITATLTVYFSGINTRNYEDAYRVLTPRYRRLNPFSRWMSGLASSQDSQITITALAAAADGTVAATVTFVSNQAAGYGRSPSPQETCTVWSLRYEFQPNPGADPPYFIDSASTGGLNRDPRPCP